MKDIREKIDQQEREFEKLRKVKCVRCSNNVYGECLTILAIKKSKTKHGELCALCMTPQEMKESIKEMAEQK